MKREKTQRQQILEYLQRGNRLTPIEALNKFGCFRLAAVIHRLKQDDHDIKAATVTWDGKQFAQYYISQVEKVEYKQSELF